MTGRWLKHHFKYICALKFSEFIHIVNTCTYCRVTHKIINYIRIANYYQLNIVHYRYNITNIIQIYF